MKFIFIFGLLLTILLATSLYINFDPNKFKSYELDRRKDQSKPVNDRKIEYQALTDLENLFDESPVEIPEDSLSIIFVGDVMLGRKVNANTIRYNDFNWPFENVADVLSDANITVVNLEGPLVYNCPTTTEGFQFCGDSRHALGLSTSGIDIANLANNHSDNYGSNGIKETKEILSKVDMQTFNADEPLTYEVNNQSITFLGYDVIFQKSGPLIPKIQKDITDTKNQAGLLIVSFHWGDEYTDVPNRHQGNLAHAAIDAGADVVIGHHPHWIQTAEFYKDKLILYSLGNFVFDQMWSENTREGLVAKLVFDQNRLIDVELMPILIEDHGQPHFLEGESKIKIIEELRDRSLNDINSREL